MIISIVQTARDREKELTRFINSLLNQGDDQLDKVQYIFVDQSDNRHLFSDIESKVLQFVYIQIKPSSLSYARNVGIQYATCDIVSFPDDDCWYPKGLLKHILTLFDNNHYSGFTGRVTNEEGVCYSHYPTHVQTLSPTKLCGASSIGMFLKRDVNLFFDENIGVGSQKGIGSGEESDYLIRYIKNENVVSYHPEIVVFHPIHLLKRDEAYLIKSKLYAVGAAYIAKKNKLGFIYCLNLIFRPLAGIIVFSFKGDLYYAKRSWYIFQGRLKGFSTRIIK